ncbi:MAG TPA: cytochrome P460 family protein [Lacipirellulaceae bacterium]|nr:cytochrome P460 family protein [Lacipirellulaceae bacterium]
MLRTARKRVILYCLVLIGTIALSIVMAAPPSTAPRIEFTAEGKLKLPTGFRHWMYVGASVTPNDLNGGAALFPEFHSVYIDPESFAHYEKTGKYRDGTVVVKELASVGGKKQPSGKGYFMGDFNSLEVAIKDSRRYKDEPGHWAYFSFEYKPTVEKEAAPHNTVSCNKCHQDFAEEDFVFSQDYPVLRAAKPKSK